MKKNSQFSGQGQFSPLKVFRHMDRVCGLLKGKAIFPVSVDLSVSNFCNQKCPWCYYRGYLEGARVMLEQPLLFGLIGELSRLGIKGINFTGGGEPLTHPALVEAMEYAHTRGIDVGLITNGVLLDRDKILRLSRIAKFIRISISCSTAQSYEKFHGAHKEDFNRLIRNIKFLGKCSLDTECSAGALFLLEPRTQCEFFETIELVKKNGLKFFEARLIKNTPCFTPGRLSPKIDALYKAAKSYADKDFSVVIREELTRSLAGYGKDYACCYAQELVTSISAEGDVYICCEFEGKKEYALGNIKQKKFKDIWLSRRRQRLVKNLDLDQCFSCCKGDGINRLFQAINNTEHVNFM